MRNSKRRSGAVFGFDERYHAGFGAQVLLGDGLGLFERDGLVFGVIKFRALPAQTVQFIKGGGGGEVAEVGAGDFFLADDLGLGALQFLRGEALGTEQLRPP